MTDLYDRDFYHWANEQAALLRAGRLSAADVEHIAEELETLGRSERDDLTDRLAALLVELIRLSHHPMWRESGSGRNAVRLRRRQIARVLRWSPSLRSQLESILADAWGDAVLIADRETGPVESDSPARCPWTARQVLDDGFWPDTAP